MTSYVRSQVMKLTIKIVGRGEHGHSYSDHEPGMARLDLRIATLVSTEQS